jgi:N-acylneuraminate cytidylyltransferase
MSLIISIIIPAKGHSERIRNKNLYKINGKSLIRMSCEKVLKCKNINKFYLDTEDEAIIKECEDLVSKGLEIIKRPKELATNFIGANELMVYGLHSIDYTDILLQTFATSPLITASTIDGCIEKFINSDSSSFLTVVPLKEYFWFNNGNENKPMNFSPIQLPNSQTLDKIYMETHGLYGIYSNKLLEYKTRTIKNPLLIEIPLIESFDIDTPEDLEIVRRLLCHTQE